MINIDCQVTFRIILYNKCFDCCYSVEYVNTESDTSNITGGGTGTVVVSFRKYPNNISGKREIKGLLETAVLGTALIRWKVLVHIFRTHLTYEMTLHVAQIVNTEQLQHCIP